MTCAARISIASGPACWELRDLTFRHRGTGHSAVDGVTLDIPIGRMTALLGPNGAGKSTLLQLMLGTLSPDSGTVSFEQRPLGAWSRKDLARAIGVVPQGETEPLFTVQEVVAMGRYPYLGSWQREGDRDKAAIAAAMARCSVTEFADRWLATLSGGERQRVRLARALAQEPTVLVLDEPTTSLDVRHEMATFELLRTLRDEGATIVLATHNLNLAARYADHLVLLHRGRVVSRGTPQSVLTAHQITQVYEWPVDVTSGTDGAPQVVPCSADAGVGR
ncbi:MAG: btuC [Gemmatimonadetes bacterium]|nr:btuC [Gemmatimonadota bacterium]